MALDVYFKEDIANILRAIRNASGGTADIVHMAIAAARQKGLAVNPEMIQLHLDIYQLAHATALNAVADAFGIYHQDGSDYMILSDEEKHQLQAIRLGLLPAGQSEAQYVAAEWRLKREIPHGE